MINIKEVITLKVPYPTAEHTLARRKHMYICIKPGIFAKVQTNTPVAQRAVTKYIIEEADINRNPFTRTSLIDRDKNFNINNSIISRDALTTRRHDICEELYRDIINKPAYTTISISEESLRQLNPTIII